MRYAQRAGLPPQPSLPARSPPRSTRPKPRRTLSPPACPLLAVTAIVERAAHKKLRPYFRDVRDHLLLVDEEVNDQRDSLTTVLQANMAVISVEQTKVSVRQNSTIEQLTILAAHRNQ